MTANLERLVALLRIAPRSSRWWINKAEELGFPAGSTFPSAISCLRDEGVEVAEGYANDGGVRRLVFWIDSPRSSLRKKLAALSVIERTIAQEDGALVKLRRSVRRGAVS